MPYKVRLSHINPDFGIEPTPETPWSVDVETDDEMVLLLNRVAITSSQEPAADCPELEILVGSKRLLVTAVGGQLYFTEPYSANRQSLKVVPDEIIRLLQNKPLEEVFIEAEAEEAPVRYSGGASGGSPLFKVILWLILLSIMGLSGGVVWKELSYRPRLVIAPDFIPSLSSDSELLRELYGVYVSEYREGGLAFELAEDGRFKLYEMWYSAKRGRFTLVQVASLDVQIGMHADESALLAGEMHLLLPQEEDVISMHGIAFHRHLGVLEEIGEVLTSRSNEY